MLAPPLTTSWLSFRIVPRMLLGHFASAILAQASSDVERGLAQGKFIFPRHLCRYSLLVMPQRRSPHVLQHPLSLGCPTESVESRPKRLRPSPDGDAVQRLRAPARSSASSGAATVRDNSQSPPIAPRGWGGGAQHRAGEVYMLMFRCLIVLFSGFRGFSL